MTNSGFTHCALLYQTEDELLDGVVHFVEPGVQAGEAVFVALGGEHLRALSQRLGEDADAVTMLDMRDVGRNPARLISTFARAVEEHGPATVHLVGEPVWPGRDGDEVAEALVHETLMNLAFDGQPVRALCPYDLAGLDGDLIAAARQTHPETVGPDGSRECVEFVRGGLPGCCHAPLTSPPPDSATLEFSISDLGRVRALVREGATRAGLDDRRQSDLVLAVNELATNSIRHGGGSGELRTWTEPERLVCEIRDAGRIANPLAGRLPPDPRAVGGHGLWLVNQIADLTQIRTGDDGTTVRLHAAVTA